MYAAEEKVPAKQAYPNRAQDPNQSLVQQRPPDYNQKKPDPVAPKPFTPRQTTPPPPALAELTDDLIAVQFENENRGRAYGKYASALVTTDGGKTWSFDPARRERGSAPLGEVLTILIRTSAGDPADPCGLRRFSGRALAAVRAACNSAVASPAGTAPAFRRPDRPDIRSIFFEGEGSQRGWAAADNGVILHTQDAGQTWLPQTRPPEQAGRTSTRLPALWYYLLTFPVVGLLLWRASRPLPPQHEHHLIEGALTSDAPLDERAPDVMGFGRMARGISRFLRHEKTAPPLTIAVDGPWGSGKSSLMNLLRADLERYGFRPVWFNAWHHQGEEHLLAALLESIRSQATPPWWRPDNWSFRFRLLRIRGQRQWLPVLLLLCLLSSLTVTVMYRHGDYQAVASLATYIRNLDFRGALRQIPDSTPTLAFLATALSTIAAFWKGLTAFGVSQSKLLASVSSSARLRDLQLQTGFRQRFAREFGDVTEALGARSLILFIDDIDRCTPQNALTVLESINFLVSSGGCFIVIAMARDMVERAVGLQFAPVVEELADDGLADPTPEQKRERRLRFARQYLDKLINIEIPLPPPTEVQARNLLLQRQTEAPEPSILQKASEIGGHFAPVGLALASIVLGFWLGSRVVQTQQQQQSAAVTQTPPPPVAPAKPTPGLAETPQEDLRNVPQSPPPRVIQAAERLALEKWLLAFGIVLIGGFAVWKLREPAGLIVYDSPEFKKAIDAWCDVVRMRQNTPRSLKRFMNRVRYMAMHQMPPEPAESWLSTLLKLRRESEESSPFAMPESTLVALSALHYVDPLLPAKAATIRPSASGDELAQAVARHKETGFAWPPNPKHVEDFYAIIPTVKVTGASA